MHRAEGGTDGRADGRERGQGGWERWIRYRRESRYARPLQHMSFAEIRVDNLRDSRKESGQRWVGSNKARTNNSSCNPFLPVSLKSLPRSSRVVVAVGKESTNSENMRSITFPSTIATFRSVSLCVSIRHETLAWRQWHIVWWKEERGWRRKRIKSDYWLWVMSELLWFKMRGCSHRITILATDCLLLQSLRGNNDSEK